MTPCFSTVTLLSADLPRQLSACAEAGFTQVELWLTQLEEHLAKHGDTALRKVIEETHLQCVSAAYQGGLLLTQGQERREQYQQWQQRLALCQQWGVGTMIIVPDVVDKPTPQDLQRAVVSLKQAAPLAASFGVRLALEFRGSSRWCASIPTACALLADAEDANLGLCLDLFHYYTGCSKFEDLAWLTPANLFMVHAADLSGTPREWAGDADRVLPGDGEFHIAPILQHLRTMAYAGPVSVELMNPQLWSIAPPQVASLAMQSLKRFLEESS